MIMIKRANGATNVSSAFVWGDGDDGVVVAGRVGLADRLTVDFDPGVGGEGSGTYAGAPGRPHTAEPAQQRGGDRALQAPSPAHNTLVATTALWAASACGEVAGAAR